MSNIDKPVYDQAGTVHEQWMKLSIEFTGDPAANPFTAFAQWQKERDAMRAIYDQYEALKILNQRFKLAHTYAKNVVEAIRTSAGLFLPPNVGKMMDLFFEQDKNLQTTITLSNDIHHNSFDHFITLVWRLRKAQKYYFKNKKQSLLKDAIQLEKEVDTWIDEHSTAEAEKQMVFNTTATGEGADG